MSEEVKAKFPGSGVVILYNGDIIPAEIKNISTHTDSGGTQVSYTLVDPENTDNKILSWSGVQVEESDVFSTIDELINHLKSEYKRKYVREISE